MAVYSAMLSASFVEKRLAYSANCFIVVLFAVVRLVTVEKSFAVACSRLGNARDISIALFAVPAWYFPCQEVF